MAAHKFTKTEIHYLKMLPAVANVTSARITYSDEFRDEATRRYLAGESPVRIFREAGLDPKLVGYKRIERSFARWKTDHEAGRVKQTGRQPVDPVADGAGLKDDPRDRLIVRQALRISQLEQEVTRLRALAGTTSAASAGESAGE